VSGNPDPARAPEPDPVPDPVPDPGSESGSDLEVVNRLCVVVRTAIEERGLAESVLDMLSRVDLVIRFVRQYHIQSDEHKLVLQAHATPPERVERAEGIDGMARLNDTVSLVRKGLEAENQHSICTHKIENGWIIEISSYNQETGEYQHRSTFSEKQPNIIPGRVAYSTGDVGNGGLSGAVRYLNSPSGVAEKWGGDNPINKPQGSRT
jgi:hypothetical protein